MVRDAGIQPESVSSPCISICALDEDDICTGCYRSALEITDWVFMNEERKREVLRLCGQRARDAGMILFT